MFFPDEANFISTSCLCTLYDFTKFTKFYVHLIVLIDSFQVQRYDIRITVPVLLVFHVIYFHRQVRLSYIVYFCLLNCDGEFILRPSFNTIIPT